MGRKGRKHKKKQARSRKKKEEENDGLAEAEEKVGCGGEVTTSMDQELNVAQAEQETARTTECYHNGRQHDTIDDHLWDFYSWFISEANKNPGSVLEAVDQKITEHPEILDHPDIVSFSLGLATRALLELANKGYEIPRLVVRLMYLITNRIKIQQKGIPPDRIDADERLRKMARRYQEILTTKRDIVLFVEKRIPCNCLEELKQQVLREPDLCRCDNCHEHVENVQVCGGCRYCLYCSQECQALAWPGHKIECRFLSGELTREEARKRVLAEQASKSFQGMEEVD